MNNLKFQIGAFALGVLFSSHLNAKQECAAVIKFLEKTEPIQIRPAAEIVIDRLLASDQKFPALIPEHKTSEPKIDMDSHWVENVLPTLIEGHFSSAEVLEDQDLSDSRSGKGAVRSIRLANGEHGIFRASELDPNQNELFFQAPGRVRKVYAAWILARILGFELIPHAKIYKIGNQVGTWSDYVPHSIPDDYDWSAHPAENLSDIIAMEFLLGQYDPDKSNYRFRIPNEKIEIVDSDLAFWTLIPAYVVAKDEEILRRVFGRILPKTYSTKFIEGIERLTPEVIQNELSLHLGADEIQSLIFRRNIILEDMRIRGIRTH